MPSSPDEPRPAGADTETTPLELPKKTVPPPLPGERGAAAEVRSLERHVCPECGGKGEWSAAKGQLVCPYCGTEFSRVAPPPPPDTIKEHELERILTELGAAAATVDTANRRVQCTHCHAVLVRGGKMVAQHCDFCGSPELLDYGAIDSPLQPESLLPARISKEQSYHALKGFLGSKWFAPSDLKRRNLVDRIKRIYLPYWTFDAAAECPWTAQSGTHYWETVRERGPNGKTRTRRVRKTRWRPASGHVSTWFDDIVVSGSRGLEPKILGKIEPFPVKDLVPYETRYVSGWQVEQYQVPLTDAARLGRGTMEAMLREMCGREVPGDTYRSLRIHPDFTRKTFKHILVPIWLLSYRFRGKTWQGATNAVTGETYARFPVSAWKVAIVTLAGLAIAALIIFLIAMAQ
jgi:uncharacterized Zn finger protein (UPF0148 family)